MDKFAAADSTSFSPSVGRIPKLYGHSKHSLPPVNADNRAADSRERAASPPGTPPRTDYGYAAPLDPVLVRENKDIAATASYSLMEVLLGVDAFDGSASPSANGNASTTPASDHADITLTVGDPGPTSLLPAAHSLEPSPYPADLYEGCSGNIAELELALTNYPVASIPSPLDTIDDLLAASGECDLISSTSRSASDDLEFSTFGSTTGRLDSDLSSFPDISNAPNYMMSILDEHFGFYDGLLSQTKQDGDSTDATDRSGPVDFCLGAGADHFVFTLTGFEFCK